MIDAPRPPRPSSESVEFRAPVEDELPDLIALQTDESLMRYYGGVRDRANIERRLTFAIEHEERFGYGLWSLYERGSGEFLGIGGVIHYNGDFNADTLEMVVCLKHEAQRRGYGRHLFERFYAWCRDAGVLERTVIRVEVGNRRAMFFDVYLGHRSYPVYLRPSGPDEQHHVYQLVPLPVAGADGDSA